MFTWHHVAEVAWNAVIVFLVITVVLTPLVLRASRHNKRLLNWLSPYTPGGVGNLPTPEGQLHERLSTPPSRRR